MIVGEPNPLVGGIHDRMPVMLMSEDYERWLGQANSVEELKVAAQALQRQFNGSLRGQRVVNNVKNDTEECIEPVDDDEVTGEQMP
jgi:putative SOS response-associated peptidase YedK